MNDRERARDILDRIAWETLIAEYEGDLDAVRIGTMRRDLVEAEFAAVRREAIEEAADSLPARPRQLSGNSEASMAAALIYWLQGRDACETAIRALLPEPREGEE